MVGQSSDIDETLDQWRNRLEVEIAASALDCGAGAGQGEQTCVIDEGAASEVDRDLDGRGSGIQDASEPSLEGVGAASVERPDDEDPDVSGSLGGSKEEIGHEIQLPGGVVVAVRAPCHRDGEVIRSGLGGVRVRLGERGPAQRPQGSARTPAGS